MSALPYRVLPQQSAPAAVTGLRYRQADALWLALQLPSPDSAALSSLAAWAQSLTPVTVLRPGEGLLLEVQGSLRYFSGLAAIRQQLAAELEQRGWSGRLATAPTPLAASWLVRYQDVDIAERSALAGALGRLPLAATAWPDKTQRMLQQMGLASIADCLRLPRGGFSRRVGRQYLDELDRAVGSKPDPRMAWQAPETLVRAIEFTFETDRQTVFAAALAEMSESLEFELRRRQSQLVGVSLAFRHHRCPDTRTHIGFVEPVHQRERILGPLLVRLEALALPEPVLALSLETSALQPLQAGSPGLLPASPDDTAAVTAGTDVPEFALLERLRGRFGHRAVHGIGTVAEHRPEHAWCRWLDQPATHPREPDVLASHRPLWLLPVPEKKDPGAFLGDVSTQVRVSAGDCETLARRDARAEPAGMHSRRVSKSPAGDRASALQRKKGKRPDSFLSERIESGWWDGQDIRRDYHVVIGPAGEKLWCYRDRKTNEWYLHGLFG